MHKSSFLGLALIWFFSQILTVQEEALLRTKSWQFLLADAYLHYIFFYEDKGNNILTAFKYHFLNKIKINGGCKR